MASVSPSDADPSDADAAAAAPSDAMQPMRPMPRYGKSSGPLALPPPASAPSPDSASAGGGLLGVSAHAKRWYASRGGLLTTGGGGDSGGSSKGGGSIFDRLLGAPAKPDPFYVRYCPALSWEDRVLGFLACLVIGRAPPPPVDGARGLRIGRGPAAMPQTCCRWCVDV